MNSSVMFSVEINMKTPALYAFDTHIFIQGCQGLQVNHRVIHVKYGCEKEMRKKGIRALT